MYLDQETRPGEGCPRGDQASLLVGLWEPMEAGPALALGVGAPGQHACTSFGGGASFPLNHFREQGRSKASPAGLTEVISGVCWVTQLRRVQPKECHMQWAAGTWASGPGFSPQSLLSRHREVLALLSPNAPGSPVPRPYQNSKMGKLNSSHGDRLPLCGEKDHFYCFLLAYSN